MGFKRLLPSIFLPTFLRNVLGYRTHAMVSMPVLNPFTVINRDFDSFELMPRHNDMAAMLDKLSFDRGAAVVLPAQHGRDALPVRAARRGPEPAGRGSAACTASSSILTNPIPPDPERAPAFFDSQSLRELHGRQIGAVSYLDGVFKRLFDLLPSNTWVIVTSDHGELFGEDRFFGHGPVMHEKVFEVPFVEGMVP